MSMLLPRPISGGWVLWTTQPRDKQECALLIIDSQPENTGTIQPEKAGLDATIISTQLQVNTKKPRHAPRTAQRITLILCETLPTTNAKASFSFSQEENQKPIIETIRPYLGEKEQCCFQILGASVAVVEHSSWPYMAARLSWQPARALGLQPCFPERLSQTRERRTHRLLFIACILQCVKRIAKKKKKSTSSDHLPRSPSGTEVHAVA